MRRRISAGISWAIPRATARRGSAGKTNSAAVHDTLGYISHDPIHRKYHRNKLTFGLIYAFHENFVLLTTKSSMASIR
jgi:1,4-alpha-glucan branching enzyme